MPAVPPCERVCFLGLWSCDLKVTFNSYTQSCNSGDTFGKSDAIYCNIDVLSYIALSDSIPDILEFFGF